MNYTEIALIDVVSIKTGKLNSNAAVENGKYPFFTCAPTPLKIDTYKYDQAAILLAGNNADGNFHINYYEGKFEAYQRTYIIDSKDNNKYDLKYLFYALKECLQEFKLMSQGTSTKFLTMAILNGFKLNIPDIITQRKIANTLSALDKKIALNESINDNLLQQAQTLYKHLFVDNPNSSRQTCRADEYFDISIGKTPPRKEPEWFSSEPENITWISISDMGNCGVYISDSNEYLTPDAIEKHNVKIVPKNTVLLSFKLTVGRIAITTSEVTTNEAIAHFKTSNNKIVEYLYCYLKAFDYNSLGSTSSIATAVNSKIIKSMPFIMPTDDELNLFYEVVAPLFSCIEKNQEENAKLIGIRTSLLPKLMSGELDVSKIGS